MHLVSSAQRQNVMTDMSKGNISSFRPFSLPTTLNCWHLYIYYIFRTNGSDFTALVLNFSLLAAVTLAWSSVCQVHTLLYGS